MMTKLFSFLLVLIFSTATAQINVSEGFESGALPSGWSFANFGITNSTSCTGSYSSTMFLGSSSNNGAIYTSNYISDGNSISVSCSFKKNSGQIIGGFVALYFIINNDGNWQTIASNSSFSNTCTTLNGIVNASSIPAGTNVTFVMYGYRTSGGANVFFDDFMANTVTNSSTEYTFDNTYSNSQGANPFSSSIYTAFTTDRNSNPTGALQVSPNANGSSANIPFLSLPTGSQNRTISLWYKSISNLNYPGIFSYGAGATNQTFGLYLNPNGGPVFQAWGSDTDFGGSFTNNTWQHVVISYNGSTVKMYKNGVYISSTDKTLNTVFSAFKIGNNSTPVVYDDLKIYNYVITDADVTSLYTNNTLTSQNFNTQNLKATLYPNPTTDHFTIEMENEAQSVEIYSLQGQKVLTSFDKNVTVSSLSKGIYLVRIEDSNNAISTQKLIVK